MPSMFASSDSPTIRRGFRGYAAKPSPKPKPKGPKKPKC